MVKVIIIYDCCDDQWQLAARGIIYVCVRGTSPRALRWGEPDVRQMRLVDTRLRFERR